MGLGAGGSHAEAHQDVPGHLAGIVGADAVPDDVQDAGQARAEQQRFAELGAGDGEFAGVDAVLDRGLGPCGDLRPEHVGPQAGVQHRPAPAGIVDRRLHIIADRSGGARSRARHRLHARVNRHVEVATELVGQGLVEGPDAREVVVEGPARDAGGHAEVLDPLEIPALLADQAKGGQQDAVAGAAALLGRDLCAPGEIDFGGRPRLAHGRVLVGSARAVNRAPPLNWHLVSLTK